MGSVMDTAQGMRGVSGLAVRGAALPRGPLRVTVTAARRSCQSPDIGSSLVRRSWRLSASTTVAPTAPADSSTPDMPDVPDTLIPLPPLTEEVAKKILTEYGFALLKSKAPDVLGDTRGANCLVIYPPAATARPGNVVLFCHGFSQPIENYLGTLQRIASEAGAIVIGPRTSFFDSLKTIAGAGAGWLGELTAAPPTKLQAAIIIDALRCIAYLSERGVSTAKISLCGHSLGAAVSIVNAAMLRNVVGVAVGAPAVKMMMESPVNPYVHMGNDLAGKDYADGVKYFTNIFPDKAKLHIMGAADDQVVGTLEVAELFSAAREAVKIHRLKDVTLFLVKGSHIGFEDKVSLEVDNPFLKAAFWIINLLVYKLEILKWLVGDYSQQLEAYRYMLVNSVRDFDGQSQFPNPADASQLGVYNVKYDMTAVKTEDAARAAFGVSFVPEEVPVPDPENQDVSVWGPSTAALLAYAGAHGFSVFKALSLFNGGLGQQPLAAEGGLLVVAAIAAALVYDNALLASGRFLKQGPLLASLSSYRFVAHSFAPVLSLVAAEQAARAGVAWAGSPFLQGPLLAVLAAEVSLALVQSWFLLELKPLWAKGVLRYGYRDPSFAQAVPAITSSVFIFILGVFAARDNPALWPMAIGPLLCTALTAIPTKVAPMFLTGNLGEVFLLLSLVISETILRH